MFEPFLLIAALVAILVVVGHYLNRLKRTRYSGSPERPPERMMEGDLNRLKRTRYSGGIGEISVRIGYDVRDLYMEGYTQKDVSGILRGEYDLEELRRRGPAKKRKKNR